jgi:hypothetical protein
MPKSNFNQFLDECEDFKKNETSYNNNNNKIIFENKQQREDVPASNSVEDKRETKKQNANATNATNVTNVTNANSSNIFLSRSVNSCQNRFSTKRFHPEKIANVNVHPNPHPNPFGGNDCGSVNKNNNVNIFKKTDSSDEVENVTTNPSSTSSVTFIEINNETFPSLAPPRTLTKSGNSSNSSNSGIPKKFKNFKDAISASVPEPAAVSPTKKKQIKALQDLHSFKTNHHCLPPPPLFVKRESEILAKSGIYNNEDDDDDGFENDNRGYNYRSYKSKPTKKQYIHNVHSDDD